MLASSIVDADADTSAGSPAAESESAESTSADGDPTDGASASSSTGPAFDEPASGLDPRARAELKELIAELGRMGKIVIVSSHILPELADFCNTVGIIEKGELLAFGPVGQIVQGLHAHRTLRVRFLGTNGDLKHFVEGQPFVQTVELAGDGELRVEFDAEDDAQAELLTKIVHAGFKIVGYREEEADLEDVFLKLTTGAVQ